MSATHAHGQTIRWHSNPWPALRNSGDTVDGHQARMCRMARRFFAAHGLPLIDAILAHDLAEVLTGDWSAPFKAEIPGLKQALDYTERLYLEHIGFNKLDPKIARIVKLLDMADAYQWADLHEPRAIVSGGFPEARNAMTRELWAMGAGQLERELFKAAA